MARQQVEYELQMRALLGMRYTQNQATWGKEGNTMIVHRAKGSYKIRTDRLLDLRELLMLVVRKEENSVGEYLPGSPMRRSTFSGVSVMQGTIGEQEWFTPLNPNCPRWRRVRGAWQREQGALRRASVA